MVKKMNYPTNLHLVQDVKLQMSASEPEILLSAKQYDRSARYISVTLYDGETAFSLPAGINAQIRATKPDGKIVVADCTVESSKIIAELSAQMLTVVGRVRADIVMTLSGSTVSTAAFFVDVYAAGTTDDAIESTDDVRDVYERLNDEADAKIAEIDAITYNLKGDGGVRVYKGSDGNMVVDGSALLVRDSGGGDYIKLYGVTPAGSTYMTDMSADAAPYTAAQRDGNGSLKSAAPTSDNDCATKKYVDEAVAAGNITVDPALSDTSENPVQNKVVKSAIDGKLTRQPGGVDYYAAVYTEDPVGHQTMVAMASDVKNNAIVVRDPNGRFEAAAPASDSDVANKKYVDDAVAGASSGGGRASSFAWRADSFDEQVTTKTISMPSFTASELKNALIFVRGTYQYTDSELAAWQTTMCTAEYPLPGDSYTIDSPATPVEIRISNSGDDGYAVVSFTVGEGSITVSVDKTDGLSQNPRISFIGIQVLGG